jgi:hypothetical protein
MNFAATRARRGETTATFTVRHPNWSTDSFTSSRGVRGRGRYLSLEPDDDHTGLQDATYDGGFSLKWHPEAKTVAFAVRFPLQGEVAPTAEDEGDEPGEEAEEEEEEEAKKKRRRKKKKTVQYEPSTPPNVVRKFEEHSAAVNQGLAHARAVPRLWYDESEPSRPQLVLSLPAYTALYATNKAVWDVLGLSNGGALLKSYQRKMSGRSGLVTVHGYFNARTQQLDVRGDVVYPAERLRARLEERQELPATVQFQAELLDVTNKPFILTPPAVPPTPEHVEKGVRELLDFASEKLNLRSNPVSVTSAPGSRAVKMRLAGTPGGAQRGPVLSFVMGDSLSSALGLSSTHRTFVFPLDEVREYSLVCPLPQLQPFEAASYPVLLLLRGAGDSVSHVDGHGYIPLLGVLRKPGDRLDPPAEGVLFPADNSTLTVDFVDSQLRGLPFARDYRLVLGLEFEKPPLPSLF